MKKDSLSNIVASIAVLNTQIGHIERDIKELKENHLTHLSTKLDSLETKIGDMNEKSNQRFGKIERKLAYWAGSMAVVIVLAEIILKLIFKV